ncbi:MAG TPA: hypothetical protein VM510_14460, partial [Caulifigura sp.]|nr:hypothetical protein [Caulifigura sp.]
RPAAGPGSDRETERQLAGILRGLSPELVGISSDRMDRVVELGQWAGEALSKGDAATVTIDESGNAKWFSGDALNRVNSPTFSLRDGHHLTLASLAGDIATRVSQNATEPLKQIDELFRFVITETMLVPDAHDQQLPGTPLESLLLGRSTASGRAWAVGVLLRQLQFDAVILEPKSKPEAWLIGVITPAGDVLLYDPRLGTCIPSEPGAAGFEKPATVEQVKQNPALLRELDVEDAPYALGKDDLASFNVRLITDSSAASQRMAKLQTMITGTLMEVFDGVVKSPLREKGLADRVIAAGAKGGWSAGDVSVWSYPEQQADAFISSGAEQSKAWKPIADVFAGPVILTQVRKQTKNENEAMSEADVRRAEEPLRHVRVIHLQGDYAEALRKYGPIRLSAQRLSMMTRNPELLDELAKALPLNSKAADFAGFWIASCQTRVNPKIAPDTLSWYTREYPQGEMIAAVPELLATAYVNAGKAKEAVAFFESGRKNLSPRQKLLLKIWESSVAKPPAESKTPEKPAEPATASPPST